MGSLSDAVCRKQGAMGARCRVLVFCGTSNTVLQVLLELECHSIDLFPRIWMLHWTNSF